MANRQDSGSNSAHQNQRPTDHNEDAIPEMTEETAGSTPDQTRGAADEEEDDEFEDSEDLDDEEEADSEGSF